ncbi:MAG: hypothetical protein BM565_06650 [Gammaproteobacteria bacterium MedPE]|nr:MAG: hypothetical protein BM565_06650 [Gammaproteobacteria bacterium MedPE]
MSVFTLAFPLSTLAQEVAQATAKTSQNHSNYPAAFFSQYQPQNAFDMIDRLPGFSFDRGDNARGFGGNAGNVLIDGARPTSKSGGLVGALKRIPAEQVERIEIIRGGVSAGDAAGQSVVANVIKRTDVTSGTWALKFRRAPYGDPKPNIEAAINTNLGEWEAVADIDVGYGPGFRKAIINSYDKNNALEESAYEERENLGRFSFTNGQISRDFALGKLTLNGRLGSDKWTNDQFRNYFKQREVGDSEPDYVWELDQINRFRTGEFGIDWVQKFDDWKWHSLALGKIEDRKNMSTSITSEQGTVTGNNVYQSDSYDSEYIIRNTYGYGGSNKFKPEFGLEIARNYSDKKSTPYTDGVQGTLSDVQVTEQRGEIFASFVYIYSDKLTIDGGLTAEFSKIESEGDGQKSKNLNFIKPRLTGNYKVNNDMNIVITAEREVGQLDFDDFSTSNSAEEDRNTSGNTDLEPEQTTNFSLSYEWNYSEKGSFKVKATHKWRDDELEEIRLDNGEYALGNAGTSKIWGVDVSLNIPTDGFLDNGLLEVSYEHEGSEFHDKIIGRHRPTSGDVPHEVNVSFRQDLVEHKFAWGFRYWSEFEDTAYRVDEITSFEGNHRGLVFVETTYFDNYKVQLEVNSVNVAKYTRTREFYEGDRNGEYNGYEVSNRRREPEYKLSIWGTF